VYNAPEYVEDKASLVFCIWDLHATCDKLNLGPDQQVFIYSPVEYKWELCGMKDVIDNYPEELNTIMLRLPLAQGLPGFYDYANIAFSQCRGR
jgi:hypothetical protein